MHGCSYRPCCCFWSVQVTTDCDHRLTLIGIPLGAAHVIRNAGASARDAFRSLVISQQLLGTTEVLVVKHTGCGMLIFDNETAKNLVRSNKGEAAAKEVEDVDFLTFSDLEAKVKEDVEWLKGTAIEKDITITGWIYEVETGKARQVV